MSASPNLRCGLCNGYLVNAVTVAGCMHSFCKECLSKNLSVSGTCPMRECKENVKEEGYHRDSTLQMIAHERMPQFFENAEKGSRGSAHANNRETQREVVQASTDFCDPDELPSICLEFASASAVAMSGEEVELTNTSTSSSSKAETPLKKMKEMREHREVQYSFRRYLRCAANVPIRILRRLLETKLLVTDQFSVHFISHRDFQDIPDDVTLRTLMLEDGFGRTEPFRLLFTLIPRANNDTSPVLDTEAMPCLVQEAPVQEEPSAIHPPRHPQAVQLAPPVVPELTVSLSKNIYNHSAPIITPQRASRKRRKPCDPPTEGPTGRSPVPAARPMPLMPNLLVGSLILPMFVAQQPFIHHSPPNMHISVPYTHPPQNSNSVESSPSKQCAPVSRHDSNIDQPILSQRENPLVSIAPSSNLEPSPLPLTDMQKARNIPQMPQPVLSGLEPILHVVPPAPSQPPPSVPPLSPKNLELPPLQPLHVPQEERSETIKMKKNVRPKPPPLPKPLLMSRGLRSKAVASVHEPQLMPSYPFNMNGAIESSKPSTRLEAMSGPARQQPPETKQSSTANSSHNEFVNKESSEGKPNSSPAQLTPDDVRSAQTALPHSVGGGIHAKPIPPQKLEEAQPPPTSANFDPWTDMAVRMRTLSFKSRVVPLSLIGRSAKVSVRHILGPKKIGNELNRMKSCMKNDREDRNMSPDRAVPLTSVFTNATTITPPMDFRRMATLNKQSLGRTLQAVLSSGRADLTKNSAALPVSNAGDVTNDCESMVARPTPLKEKILKRAAVDSRVPNSNST